MALCPSGQKTTIEWQYSGEAKQRIVGADDYSVERKYSQPTNYVWQYNISEAYGATPGSTFSDPKLGCFGTTRVHYSCSKFSRRTELDFDPARIATACYAPIYAYRVTDFTQADKPCPAAAPWQCQFIKGCKKIQVLCHGINNTYSAAAAWFDVWWDMNVYSPSTGILLQVPYGTEQSVIYDSSTNRYIGNLAPGYDWQYFRFIPLSSRLPSCFFKVLKQGQVVYQKTRSDCPTVTYTCGNNCPPGTCQCDRGTEVCCYDTVTGKAVKSFRK
jgi:hypothetical protein